jgi:competence protein ComEA
MASRASFRPAVAAIGAALLAPILLAQTNTQPSLPADAQARFPPGPGRDALFKVCSDCHGPESVLGHVKTHDEWIKTLDAMAENGAHASDEEWREILAYLDKHYSLIFINTATAHDLESMLDVTPAVADAIVARRSESGRYTNIAELLQVRGVAAATVEARKDRFVF